MNAIGANRNDWDKHFKLMADIDLSAYTGTSFNIIGSMYGSFGGVFDGNGYTISNFTYTSTDTNRIGLFGYVSGENARIKDLGLIDPDVDTGTGDRVGSLAGCLGEGTITNCYVVGGSVSGADAVGGLLGVNGYGTITNCYAQGNGYGTITNCYAQGCSVMGTGFDVGGLVGYNGGLITNCYSAGSVSGMMDAGGLVGKNDGGTVTESFWDTQTSGQVTSDGGTGKTIAEMQTESTFTDAGWDFVAESINGTEDIWRILEGQDYPRLTWEQLLDASPDDFVDVWLNDDPNTRGITRLIIGHKISGRGSEMTVHGYGKAHPYDSDWGTINVPYTGNPFVAIYEHGFKTNTLTIHLVTLDSLHVHSSNVFHDGTNRDYEADYYMHRAVGPEEIVINIDEDFEYVPQGWPLGLSVGQTPAVGTSARSYEALVKEPEYGSGQVLYGYIPLGNSNDSNISFAVDTSSINNWVLYVDTNNNEDLTDDGPPRENEGTGKLAALISLHVEVITVSGETIVRPYQLWFWLTESESPLFYTRCHYRSQISIGEEQYIAIAYEIRNHDVLYHESGLWIDLNRDGKLDKSEENFEDGAVISIKGKEYVLRLNYP
jgi:hypothetical protein